MRIVREFPRKVIEHADWGIVMPDGCRLSARVWMPADAESDPVPVILEHLPYRKRDGTAYRDCLTHPWFAGHGYACIRVDMRGNGDSEGLMDDEYTDQEWADAISIIEWASAQPWCNGRVGMMGISWGGFNALQVAALAPPALRAIVTLCSTVDRYADDIHYKGGALLGENIGWAANMLSYSSRPPDKALVGDKWRDLWLNRLEHMPDLAARWHQHQSRDAYWKRGSVCEDYPAIRAAVLSIGGWHDGYRNTVSHLVENLAAPAKGIVGPWIHKYPHYAAPQPAIGFLQEAKRWWDHWLKDEPTGVQDDPAMRLWLMDSVRPAAWHPERPGRWIAERQWPSPAIAIREYSLTDFGLSATSGSLDRIVSSPQDCGLTMGEYFPFMFGPELPVDQRADDALSACFDTVPIRQPLDIVGAPQIRLTVAADRPQANVCVRLCDVHPDGASELVSWGILNLCHHESRETPRAIQPGAAISVSLTLDQCAYRIPAGHRLRIAVSTACWPMVWPSPQTVSLRLLGGALSVPVRPAATENEWQFEEPEGAQPWATEELRPSSSSRRIERDVATGKVHVIVENDFGEVRDREHGLVNGSRAREVWAIAPADPLSASVDIEWEQTGGRDDWAWRTLARTTMTCSATAFQLSSSIEAWENDEKVFSRDWRETVPRRHL